MSLSPSDLDSWPHVFEPAGSAAAPPLLVLHGTGGNERDLIPLARELSPESALFSPRGAILEHGMPRFFARFSDGSFDEQDLKRRTEELAELTTAAAERYGIELSRLIALGFSNGANIAVSLLLRRPEILAGAALLRPAASTADASPDLSGRQVLIASGRLDPWAPPADVDRLVERLRDLGAEVSARAVDAGHQLTQEDLAAAGEWFRALPR